MRPIKDYIKIDEFGKQYFEDPDTGLHFKTLEDLLQIGILEYCACGNPQENLKLIHGMLVMKEEREKLSESLSNPEMFKNYREYMKNVKKYVADNWEQFFNFFWYVMDEKEIMSHGSSIPGWIEDDNFFEALKEWHKKEYGGTCE